MLPAHDLGTTSIVTCVRLGHDGRHVPLRHDEREVKLVGRFVRLSLRVNDLGVNFDLELLTVRVDNLNSGEEVPE